MNLRKPGKKWPKEFEELYHTDFLSQLHDGSFFVSNEMFSNNEVLDCLETETHSVFGMINLLRKNLNNNKINSILIIGAGSGRLGTLIKKIFPKISLFEIDKNPEVIARLQNKYKEDSTRKPIFCEAHKMPFKDESIDVVICYSVFRYIENDQEVLNEFMRVVKKDGFIIVSEAKDKSTIEKVKNKLSKNNVIYKAHTIPTVRLPHLTFFYYLVSKYGHDKKITKFIDQNHVNKKINVTELAFELANSSLGSIYSIIWGK